MGSAQLAQLWPRAGRSRKERPVPRSAGGSHCGPCSQPGQSRPRPRPGSPKQPRQAAQEHAGGPGAEQQRPLPAALTRSAAAAGPGCPGGRAAPASWPLSPLEAVLLLSSPRCRGGAAAAAHAGRPQPGGARPQPLPLRAAEPAALRSGAW